MATTGNAAKCSQLVETALSSGQTNECALDSDIQFAFITAPPTSAQIAAICQTPTCTAIVTAAQQATSTDCLLDDGNANATTTTAPPVVVATSAPPASSWTTPGPSSSTSMTSGDPSSHTPTWFIIALCIVIPGVVFAFASRFYYVCKIRRAAKLKQEQQEQQQQQQWSDPPDSGHFRKFAPALYATVQDVEDPVAKTTVR